MENEPLSTPYPEPSGKLTRREIEAAGAALLALQRGLTGDRRLAGRAYMDDRELLGAYLLYYWPVSYMQSLDLPGRTTFFAATGPRPRLRPGPGLGGPDRRIPLRLRRFEYRRTGLVDDSSRALDLAESIIAGGSRRPGRIEKSVLDLESDAELPEGPFDLIVAAHCLNELWRLEADAPKRREGLIRRAAERLAPGGRILLVEPALLATCRDLIALRDALVSSSWRVFGPCPGSFACPAFAAGPERSCHVQAPWTAPEIVASLAKAAGLDRTSVKFAYFFLSPEPAPEEGPSSAPRRSDQMLNKAGRLRYVLCGEGRLETISARGDDAGAAAKGFMSLRRGDTLVARGLESREGGGYGLLPDSELDLRTRAPEASS